MEKRGLTWSMVARVAGLDEHVGCTTRSQTQQRDSEEDLTNSEYLMREIEDLAPSENDNDMKVMKQI